MTATEGRVVRPVACVSGAADAEGLIFTAAADIRWPTNKTQVKTQVTHE